MVVLLTGASGFIGSHLVRALTDAGHEVICAMRGLPEAQGRGDACRFIPADFTRDFDPSVWSPRLAGVNVVVNAVGILREQGRQTFDAIHVRAPRALFSACTAGGIKVVQISALGADADAASRYHKSKREADEALLALGGTAVVAQPSLVFGPRGSSARLFTTLASLPLIPLPDGGRQTLQPIHIDDLVHALVRLVETDAYSGCRVPLAGPQAVSLRELLADLRQALGLGHGLFISLPRAASSVAARFAQAVPGALLDPETLAMLRRGNTADAGATTRLLGHPPRPPSAFVGESEAHGLRTTARLVWLLPVLRFSIALVWIVTGILSLGVYPVEQSYALLERAGLTGLTASIALYGAAALDLAFGIAILTFRRRRMLWLAQAAIIIGYTAIITLALPEFWLHPYGPVLKNLPLLAGIWVLHEIEER
jgi:uncharacterized protein YbjT (DUF2867 family)